MRKFIALFVMVLSLAACGDSTNPGGVATLQLLAPSTPLHVGQSAQLTAMPLDKDGRSLETSCIIEYRSTDPSVASVNANGVVTGIKPGVTTIQAATQGKLTSQTITVVAGGSGANAIASVTITPNAVTVTRGATATLTAVAHDSAGGTVSTSFTWASNNPAVATVSQSGVVTAVANGAAAITATSENGRVGTAVVSVADASAAVQNVVITPASASIGVGATVQLTATPTDAAGNVLNGRQVTWTSTSPSIASVSSSGVVTGVGAGTTTVTGSVEGKSATASITVSASGAGSITLAPSTLTLNVGKTAQLTATVTNANGQVVPSPTVVYVSSNTGVATVSSTGLVTGTSVGTATITATSNGQSTTATVTVANVPVSTIAVTPATPTVFVGQSLQLSATTRDGSGNVLAGRVVTWTSSAPGTAVVSSSGVVTGIAAGSATITAASEGKTATATVTVSPAPVATLLLQPDTSTVTVGKTVPLTATLRDAQGNVLTGRTVTYSSGQPNVATVSSSGVVTGVAAGAATITATSEGKSDNAVVLVSETPIISVVIDGNPSVCAGQTAQLTAHALDAQGSILPGRVIDFVSSNPLVASVTQNGLLSGLLSGVTNIIASSGGVADTVQASICLAPVVSASLAPIDAQVSVGGNIQLTTVLRDLLGNILTGRPITYTSSNSAVATVSANGLVTGVAPGTATITATSDGKSTTSTVNVASVPVASMILTPGQSSLPVGQTLPLNVSLLDAVGNLLSGRLLSYTSSNPGVASVSPTGLLTALAPGSTTITALSEGVSRTMDLVVTDTLIPVNHVVVSPKNISLLSSILGQQLTATPMDVNNNPLLGRACTWSSSNNNIATVSPLGLLTRVTNGTVTITATCEGKSDTATVTLLGLGILGL